MKLISVHLARLVALLDVQSLDPRGSKVVPELFGDFGERYGFSKMPQTLADMDLTKGVVYTAGRLGELAIDSLTLYTNGLIIDTRSSTDNCEEVLADILASAKETLGATVESNRRHYASQFYFQSDIRMSLLNPVLQKVADVLSEGVSSDMKHAMAYETTGVFFNFDQSQTRIPPSQFTIERKAETPFAENTYFSLAPLRTKDHWELLTMIEDSMQ